MDCKPGSVPVRGCPRAGEDHSSRRRIAASLEHSHPDVGATQDARSLGRAARCDVPIRACSGRGLPRRRSPGCRAWALTPRFHPYLCLTRRSSQRRTGSPAIGGVVSVALSLGLPRVAVNDLPCPVEPGLSSRGRYLPTGDPPSTSGQGQATPRGQALQLAPAQRGRCCLFSLSGNDLSLLVRKGKRRHRPRLLKLG